MEIACFPSEFLPRSGLGPSRHEGRHAVSYTHLRAHETKANLVCRLLLEKKKISEVGGKVVLTGVAIELNALKGREKIKSNCFSVLNYD